VEPGGHGSRPAIAVGVASGIGREEEPMEGDGHLEYYAAVATIYPLLGLALLVESGLSAQAHETLRPETPKNPRGHEEYKRFYWR
jgi:hypothetical protein